MLTKGHTRLSEHRQTIIMMHRTQKKPTKDKCYVTIQINVFGHSFTKQ